MSWDLTGNAGTDPAIDFLGTTDARPLVITTGGVEAAHVVPEGRVGIDNPAGAPLAPLDLLSHTEDVLHAFTDGDVSAAMMISESPQTTRPTCVVFAGGGPAVAGTSTSGRGPGVHGTSTAEPGVLSENPRQGCGVNGRSDSGTGLAGLSRSGIGVFRLSDASTKVVGLGRSEAGRFLGDVTVTGTLSKAAGQSKINHPFGSGQQVPVPRLGGEPADENVYDGVVTSDEQGEATVRLGDWFEEVNTDVRYQLTPIGAPGPDLHISEEVVDNQSLTPEAAPA
jgi:hypothetical protein